MFHVQTREEGKALLSQITKTSGIPDTIGQSSSVEPMPIEVNDSIAQNLFSHASATPAPHLSPRNLHFITPDH